MSIFSFVPLIIFQLSAGEPGWKKDLVSLADLDSEIELDMVYFYEKNFIGRRINGYKAKKCLLTHPAAKALIKVRQQLKKQGYDLIVYDCYRPQRAVDDFVAWTKDLTDQKMKESYYPHVEKSELITLGYIASKSGHSRGSTVDLSIKELISGKPVEMGTKFDFFDPRSNTRNPLIDDRFLKNREILLQAMKNQGFSNYSKEWWHFTLAKEPFPKTHFDFEID